MREPDGHLPSLDGLRGIAAAMVVLFHVGESCGSDQSSVFARVLFRLTSYGAWGVDLFFVLSGFLITRILLATEGKPGYFRSFYARRALRIFPAYYLYLALLAVALFSIPAAHTSRDSFSQSWPWYALYLTNIKLAYFFDLDAASVQHLWTLAVEEQFYLFWPALIALVPARVLPAVTCALIATVVVSRGVWLAHGADPYVVHVLSWTRLDALAIGAVLAMAHANARLWPALPHAAPFVAAAAFAGHFVPGFGLQYICIALFFAAVLVLCIDADARGHPHLLLRSQALQRLGAISYGIYLFHFFFVLSLRSHVQLAFGRELLGFIALLLAVSLATWIAAALSFRYVESPALALKKHFPRPRGQT